MVNDDDTLCNWWKTMKFVKFFLFYYCWTSSHCWTTNLHDFQVKLEIFCKWQKKKRVFKMFCVLMLWCFIWSYQQTLIGICKCFSLTWFSFSYSQLSSFAAKYKWKFILYSFPENASMFFKLFLRLVFYENEKSVFTGTIYTVF